METTSKIEANSVLDRRAFTDVTQPGLVVFGGELFASKVSALEESALNCALWMAAARTRAAADRNFAVDDPKGAS